MPLQVLEHALAADLVSRLRDVSAEPPLFRTLTHRLTRLLMAEATRDLPTKPITVQTPLESTPGRRLATQVVLVPILRAGLGMLEAALDCLPEASVGYLGLERDEATAVASSYYHKLPPLEGGTALLLDPMLATGGSASAAMSRLYAAGAASVTLLCVVAAPEGVARLSAEFLQARILTAALDRGLNDRKYIVPGLGDFGDRLFGTL